MRTVWHSLLERVYFTGLPCCKKESFCRCSLLDCAAEPELLLDIDDSASGWKVVLVVVRSLEEEDVKSLEGRSSLETVLTLG
jgi:hypothetical protein